jgi:hypothetical protein
MTKSRKGVFDGEPLLTRSHLRSGSSQLWDSISRQYLRTFILELSDASTNERKRSAVLLVKRVELFRALLKLTKALRQIGQIEGREERDIEILRMYKSGVIKQTSLVSYLMRERHWSKRKAIDYISRVYGMKPSTQSVLLSGEFESRQKEKKATKRKNRLRQRI